MGIFHRILWRGRSRRRRQIIGGTFLLLAFSLVAVPVGTLGYLGSTTPASALMVEVSDLDVGLVSANSTHRVTFVIRNPGNRSVRLTEIRPTCGCTKVSAERMEIPAGESTNINASVLASPNPGVFRVAVAVRDNSGNSAPMMLHIGGTVAAPELRLSPDAIELGRVGPGSVSRFSVILTNTDKTPLDVKWVPNSGLQLLDWADQTIQPGSRVAVTAEVTVPSDVGIWAGPSLAFECNGHWARKIEAKIRAVVQGKFSAIPPTVAASWPQASERPIGIRVVSTEGTPSVSIARAESTLPFLRIVQTRTDQVSIVTDTSGQSPSEDIHGEIRLWIADAGLTTSVVVPAEIKVPKLR